MKKIFFGLAALPLILLASCAKQEQATPAGTAASSSNTPTGVAHRPTNKFQYSSTANDCMPGGDGCLAEVIVTGRCPFLIRSEMLSTMANGTPAKLKELFANSDMQEYLPEALTGNGDFMALIQNGAYSVQIATGEGKNVYAFGTSADVSLAKNTYIVPVHY